jgi:predicted alpha/beta superfamily hydrolase
MKVKMVSVLFVMLFIPFAAMARKPGIDRLQGLSDTKIHELVYKPLNQTYYVYVRLPENYDSKKKYPTVYLLDGGHTYPMLASYYRYLNFSGEVPDMIVVGISYGSDERSKGNQRSRDLTAPSKEREYWGGAKKFSEFLRSGLFPLVEEKYASNEDKRIVFGQSLGGQYVLYAAQAESGLFWGHIASNPALHRNLAFFLKTRPAKSKSIKLFVSSGTKDEPTFFKPAQDWVKHWKKETNENWNLKTELLDGHTHFSAAPEAFRRGLAWMFLKNN